MLLVWAWTEWVCIVAGKCLFLAGRPSTITCTTFLGKGPSLPQGSWWCVLRVRSSCLSTEGSRVSWSTSWRIFGCNWPLSHSWLDTPVVLLCQVTLQPSLLFVFSSPSFPRVGSCFPTPFTFLHLAPLSPLFVFCPSHQLLSLHSFFCPFTAFRLSS